MNCPRCKRTFKDASAGPYRGAAEHEAPVALTLETHKTGAVLHRCERCGGAFVPAYDDVWRIQKEARSVSSSDIARRAYAPAGKTIRCVGCDAETTRREWGIGTLVFVDICIECRGVWFDGGELEALEGLPVAT